MFFLFASVIVFLIFFGLSISDSVTSTNNLVFLRFFSLFLPFTVSSSQLINNLFNCTNYSTNTRFNMIILHCKIIHSKVMSIVFKKYN